MILFISYLKSQTLFLKMDKLSGGHFSDYTASQPVKVGNKLKEADFPDALIVNKALYVTKQKSQTLKCVYTFDKAAQEIPGTEKP